MPNGAKNGTVDVHTVEEWHTARPTANWGWALDETDVVLDIDPRNGFSLDDLDAWEQIFGFERRRRGRRRRAVVVGTSPTACYPASLSVDHCVSMGNPSRASTSRRPAT